MNPQPPVTKMRIGALPSSGDEPARGEIEAPPPLAERFARIDWTFWGIVAFGAFLRFLFLSMKPPHFDEGINGWFVDQMMKTGFYRYDPTNYHGPLHFYILFLSQALFGRHIWALRLPVVLASIGSIFVTLKFEPLRRPHGQPDRRARDGDFARLHFLRPLLDPRSVAAAFLDALRARACSGSGGSGPAATSGVSESASPG